MSELGSAPAPSVGHELSPDFERLLERLEAVQTRLEEDTAAAQVLDELVDAVRDVKEMRRHLLERVTYFEQLTADERRRYHDLFDRAPDAYIVTSTSGLILEANATASTLLERDPNHLLGKPLHALVPPDGRRAFQEKLRELSHTPSDAFELELETRSGRQHVEARATAESAVGGADQLRWILRDVTARREAEAAVRSLNADLERRIADRTRELTETSARLESVLQEMPQAVVIVDGSGSVQMANRRAEELTQRSTSDLGNIVEDPPWRMYGRDGRELDHDERPLVRALATGESVANERIRVVRNDGTTVFLDFAATPVRGAYGTGAVIGTFQDVTAQELRERAERDFITNASHELQTPIAAITSAIEVLEAGAKDRREDRERFLGHIARACDRLTRLTHALLVLARAQTGDERPRSEVIAVRSLLKSVARSVAGGRGIEIACDGDLAVIGNRPLLEQAVLNLVHNALKHTAGPVRIDAATDNGHVAIVVRDSGPGIPDVDRDRVFDRFYRRGAGDNEGFGLGLAIVAEVARALGGSLDIRSSDTGTSVALSLPAARLVPK